MKPLKEWTIRVPWGNIALISFGNESGEPVLLIHGRQDSAATFFPLLDHLPDTYHYVAFDMPGNGKSDPFPPGIRIQRFHFLGAMEMVVKHLGWKHFIFMGHSMGCEQGLFFNAVFPDIITRIVLLDAGPTLQRLQLRDPAEYQSLYYDEYYNNYQKANYSYKVYTKDQAVKALMRARGLTEELAEMLVARNLIPLGEDKYRLSWDNRLKLVAPQNYPNDYYFSLFKSIPPALLVAATEGNGGVMRGKEGADWLINEMAKKIEDFEMVTVDGPHDVHILKPEVVSVHIRRFLDKKFRNKAKL